MNQTDYFTEKIDTLPEDIQEAIRASNHEAILKEIQKEYKLHIDQAQTLEILATQLIFGDIDAPQFVNGMFNEAHVSSAVAGDILLKIDLLILKEIREYVERIEEIKRIEEEREKLLMSEEEEIEQEKANAYAAYYADVENIRRRVAQELIDEGVMEDGSNITDEMIAKEMGISVEEFRKQSEVGGIKGSQAPIQNIQNEKEELLHELESPEKSFTKPLFKVAPTIHTPKELSSTPSQKSTIEKITLPDHQLQNTHVEKPYVEEVTAPEPATAPKTPTVSTSTEPVIKKPTKLTLSVDPYKEPIE